MKGAPPNLITPDPRKVVPGRPRFPVTCTLPPDSEIAEFSIWQGDTNLARLFAVAAPSLVTLAQLPDVALTAVCPDRVEPWALLPPAGAVPSAVAEKGWASTVANAEAGLPPSVSASAAFKA